MHAYILLADYFLQKMAAAICDLCDEGKAEWMKADMNSLLGVLPSHSLKILDTRSVFALKLKVLCRNVGLSSEGTWLIRTSGTVEIFSPLFDMMVWTGFYCIELYRRNQIKCRWEIKRNHVQWMQFRILFISGWHLIDKTTCLFLVPFFLFSLFRWAIRTQNYFPPCGFYVHSTVKVI